MEDFTQEIAKSLGIKVSNLQPITGNATSDEKSDIWDHEGTLQAVYMGFSSFPSQSNPGKNSNLYKFQTKSGETVSIWGCKVLDDCFLTQPVGVEVAIKYAGKRKLAGGRSLKDYKVFKIV